MAVEGPRGVKENIRLARELTSWLAPMLDQDVRDMTRPGGPIEMLADKTKKAFTHTIDRQVAARGVGIAA